jgi:ACS family hexuronate transporter-like MFS transporter
MKVRGLRWYIIALIFLATVINYVDRTSLGIMWGGPEIPGSISATLGLDKADYGFMLNVFMVSYALGQMLTGRFLDRVGTRIGFAACIGVWGIATCFHALARGVVSFSLARALLGFSEAGNWPGAVKSNAEWFPVRERAIAQGIFNAGASLGSVVAPPLIAMLFIAFGWKWTFVMVGGLGLLWIIPWWIVNKAHPSLHPWLTQAEKDWIESDRTGKPTGDGSSVGKVSLRSILSHREAWAVICSRFFLEPIWWLFVGWMPIYLFDVYQFDVKQVGMFAWFPYVGAAIGSIVGGIVSGRIIAASGSIDKGRKLTITIGAVIMFLGLLATLFFATSPIRFVMIVFVVLFGFQFAIGNIQTLPSDCFSGKSVASVAGMGGMIGVFSVIIMNFLVPRIAAVSYTPIFIGIAVFVPLGVLAIHLFAPVIRRVDEAR